MAERIKAAIGDEPVAAFARRCGFGESLLRKYLQGSEPSATNLAKIADAAGVTLDWLATGRGPRRPEPKQSTDFQELEADPRARRWAMLRQLVEEIGDDGARGALLDEFFARAQKEAELDELKRAVRSLIAAQRKVA